MTKLFLVLAVALSQPAAPLQPTPDPIGHTAIADADTMSNPIVCALLLEDWINLLDQLIIAKDALQRELDKGTDADPAKVFELNVAVAVLQQAVDDAALRYYGAGCLIPLPIGPF
jgi:hypothetical protein